MKSGEVGKQEPEMMLSAVLDQVGPRLETLHTHNYTQLHTRMYQFRSDWYHWARTSGLYISRDDLLSRRARLCKIVVVDTRDEDCCGGMITGTHCT